MEGEGTPGERLAAIAGLQDGLVISRQLRVAGLTAAQIRRRRERGELFRIHRGVYLVGHRGVGEFAEMLAAVLACGERAALSHAFSAYALAMLAQRPAGPIDVTTSTKRRERAGIRTHSATLERQADIGHIGPLAVTSPARTLLDMASVASVDALAGALDRGRAARLLRNRDIIELQARTPTHRGWPALKRLIATESGPDFSRSEAELQLLRIIREANLPAPRRNVRISGFEVDFYWPDAGLVVEVDGYAYHSSRDAFERDRRKTIALQDLGLEVVRLSWRQISERLATASLIARRLERLAAGT